MVRRGDRQRPDADDHAGAAVAPARTRTYSVTLTVRDDGGETTDTVDLTVTDTKGPALSHVPSSLVTADATSAAGATVAFGPVMATDAVDGSRPVACSRSGVFPIGDTAVACTASDSRGNSASARFTVRVLDVKIPGHIIGDGFVRADSLRYEFEFDVRERAYGAQRGSLDLRVVDLRWYGRSDRFYARDRLRRTQRRPDDRPGQSRRPQVDTVLFSGTGNGTATWLPLRGLRRRPVRDRESSRSVRITIPTPNGALSWRRSTAGC
jgi:PKD repeat protein